MSDIWSQEEEAKRLSDRFEALKLQGIGQAKFARDHKFPGGASMVSQHIKGRRPMTLNHATIYADGFGCGLEEISPRLAADVSAANKTVGAGKMVNQRHSAHKTDPDGLVAIKMGELTIANAVGVLAHSMAPADALTRKLIAPLLVALTEDPSKADEIAQRIDLTLAQQYIQANRAA